MKKPNARVKKVFEKKLENAGKGVSAIMKEMDYKEGYYKNPQEITNSKSWIMLMDEYIPESLILKTHKEAFTADRTISVVSGKQATGTDTDFVDVPDWQTRMKATELGYKVRGKLIDKGELSIVSLKGLLRVNYAGDKSK